MANLGTIHEQYSTSSLLIATTGEVSRDRIANHIDDTQWRSPFFFVGSLQELGTYLSELIVFPEVILIELPGTDQQSLLGALDVIAEQVPSSISVYAFGEINDIRFYNDLKNIGIIDYFPEPPDSLTLKQLCQGNRELTPQTQRLAIGMIGLAGGVGTSTLAINISTQISHICEMPVLLINASPSISPLTTLCTRDFPFEKIDSGMDIYRISERFSILDCSDEALSNSDRENALQSALINRRVRNEILIFDLGPISIAQMSKRELPLDYVIFVGEPDSKTLSIISRLKDILSFYPVIHKRMIALTRIDTAARVEFDEHDFKFDRKINLFLFYKNDPLAWIKQASSGLPILPKSLLKDQYAFEKLFDDLGLKYANEKAAGSSLRHALNIFITVIDRWTS